MPYENEHAFRVNDPNKYKYFRRENDAFGDGISVIWGITEDKEVEIQAIRFDKEKWTIDEARKWMENHKIKAIEIEPAIEQEIKIFPVGEHIINNKLRKFDDKFFQKIIESFNSDSLSKPYIDKNHEMKESFGDIVDLTQKEDGLYAKIKLNAKGIELIKNNEYKYISPCYGPRTDTEGKEYEYTLITVSLTNNPALEGTLPQLQEQIQLEGERNMEKKELLKKILASGIVKLEDENADFDAKITDVLGKLYEKLQEISEMALQIKTLQDEKSALTTKVEEQEKEIKKAIEEKEKLEKEKLEKEATERIKMAVEQGQYPVALMEMKIQQYMKDKAEIEKELELLPKKTQSKTHEELVLSEEDQKIVAFAKLDIKNPRDMEILKMIKEKENG